jgi:phage FluMu protein gp41
VTDATALQETKKTRYDFVTLDNGHLSGTLTDGLVVGDSILKEFELRVCTVADMFAAEQNASPERFLAFRGALIARQLVRLGDLSGPIDFDLIGQLTPRDLGQLIDALDAVEVPEKKA